MRRQTVRHFHHSRKVLNSSAVRLDDKRPTANTKDDSLAKKSYQAPTNPSGIPLRKILTPHFPLAYKDSLQEWKQRGNLQAAQDRVMSLLPFYPLKDHLGRLGRSIKTPVWDSGEYMNEFEISRPDSSDKANDMVLLHGYGAGLGFFYRNLEPISRLKNWTIHALDLLGYGLSSRPEFRIDAKNPIDGVLKAENWFIESIERWRESRGISQFTLVAHSLGAYIGTQYAIRYPHRVKKIMLVSPAGVDRNPLSIPQKQLKDLLLPGELLPHIHKASKKLNIAPAWFKFLWERNVSPFTLVRATGPLGPRFTSGWTVRRFANLPEEEAKALHKYTYAIFNARGSGEYALNYLLAPGGYARWPLSERAHRLSCESMWVYGDRDWMDPEGAVTAIENIKANNKNAISKLVMVKDAGHHIYLDNSEEFNRLVVEFLEDSTNA